MSKELILKTFKRLGQQNKTAKFLGISRQRVHQVVRGYRNVGQSGREKLYKLCWKEKCQVCLKNNTSSLHHKDFDNKNDCPENLISVCTQCHYNLHIPEKVKKLAKYIPPSIDILKKTKRICRNCGDKDDYYAKGLCHSCYQSRRHYLLRNRLKSQ